MSGDGAQPIRQWPADRLLHERSFGVLMSRTATESMVGCMVAL